MPAISVEVVYALSDRQTIVRLQLDSRSTVRQAISASGVLQAHPEIDLEQVSVGIWSRATTLDGGLMNGDRIEIYRPLIADPKITRRRRAGEAAVRKRSPARRSNRC
jgi:putative ubiquitin-RnfH superfamily antitoxin RatB of RatAB toxin-antitoxin module